MNKKNNEGRPGAWRPVYPVNPAPPVMCDVPVTVAGTGEVVSCALYGAPGAQAWLGVTADNSHVQGWLVAYKAQSSRFVAYAPVYRLRLTETYCKLVYPGWTSTEVCLLCGW